MLAVTFPTWMQMALIVLGAALVFSSLCRARHMTKRGTVPAIRYATTALAASGFLLIVAALLRNDLMLWAVLLLAASVLAVQISSARYWRRGQPDCFSRPSTLDLSALRDVTGGRK